MNKSELRKKILKIRKENDYINLSINLQSILKILKKKKLMVKFWVDTILITMK